jgi:hypothetical protein
MTGLSTNSGARLLRQWNIPAKQAMYHKDGVFFMPLERFPGAYCDPNGYIVFATQQAFDFCRHISVGKRANVHQGISNLPGYVRVK